MTVFLRRFLVAAGTLTVLAAFLGLFVAMFLVSGDAIPPTVAGFVLMLACVAYAFGGRR